MFVRLGRRDLRFGGAVASGVLVLCYVSYYFYTKRHASGRMLWRDYLAELERSGANTGDRHQLTLAAEEQGDALDSLLDELLHVPEEEVGTIAICASLYQEARFLTEWLLYNRAIGVDRFYLYDTGSTDEVLEVLQPWLEAGTVKLHRFNTDQNIHFQLNSLESCSREYASQTEWLLDCDIDEFYVVPPSLVGKRYAALHDGGARPKAPLRSLLLDNYLYQSADVVAASRVTWKNRGFQRLVDDSSVLAQQTLRDIYHSIRYDKLEYTKSLVHTQGRSGWIIPGAHCVKNRLLSKDNVTVILADGQAISKQLEDLLPDVEEVEKRGTFFAGRFPSRSFEPLVMYHFVERDLDNCLAKLARARIVRKGGWRDQAGAEGCKGYEMYQPDGEWVPVHNRDSFYGGAITDLTMADSWYGQNLPSLIHASLARAHQLSSAAKGDKAALPFQPTYTDVHPTLREEWEEFGFDLAWGETPEEKAARESAPDPSRRRR
ncbi:hypothetical protein JCM10207_008679 [Rhodosporidiobolus poonsookiae]